MDLAHHQSLHHHLNILLLISISLHHKIHLFITRQSFSQCFCFIISFKLSFKLSSKCFHDNHYYTSERVSSINSFVYAPSPVQALHQVIIQKVGHWWLTDLALTSHCTFLHQLLSSSSSFHQSVLLWPSPFLLVNAYQQFIHLYMPHHQFKLLIKLSSKCITVTTIIILISERVFKLWIMCPPSAS